MTGDTAIEHWFLPAAERGNRHTRIDERRGDGLAWTTGNRVEVIVHGAPYFEQLYRALADTKAGDTVSFTDWRGDPDTVLAQGEEFADILARIATEGVAVRGLVWRSHPEIAGFQLEHHQELAARVDRAGGLILLDERVRSAGSHHQKLVLIRRAGGADVAFVGGIDLCYGRRDDRRHLGDPRPDELDQRYGPTPPWHDIQLRIEGPAIGDLDLTFRERWEDPTKLDDLGRWRRVLARKRHLGPERRDPLPPQPPDPGPAGSHAVQVLRTYPPKHPPFPFAPAGERSIVRAYRRSFERARKLIYVEDQYLWSREVARLFAAALSRHDELRLMIVVPRIPDRNGVFSGPPHRLAQLELVDRLLEIAPERMAIFDIENEAGTPIYVHAKTLVIDDVWAEVGSDNLNRRSWTHDSELSCALLDAERDPREPLDPAGLGDGARVFARDLRLTLMREHLAADDDEGLLDPIEAFERARASADALDAWHADGRRGPRPPGRLRHHRLPAVAWWERWWTTPLYRTLVDPDARPRAMRRRHAY